MNTIKLSLTIFALVFTSSVFAAGNDNVHISGTYKGTIEHRKVHVDEGQQVEDVKNKNYDIKLTFNHDQFIWQDEGFACSGTYEAVDGILHLNVLNVRGEAAYELNERVITYDKSRDQLQLYSAKSLKDGRNSQDIVILDLSKI